MKGFVVKRDAIRIFRYETYVINLLGLVVCLRTKFLESPTHTTAKCTFLLCWVYTATYVATDAVAVEQTVLLWL